MNMSLIEEKMELENEIKKAQMELSELGIISDLRETAGRARTEHNLILERAKYFDGIFIVNKNEEIEKLSKEADEAEKSAADAENKQQELKATIAELNGRLDNIQVTVLLGDVVAIQSRKTELEGLIKKLKETLQAEEQKNNLLVIDDSHPLSVLTVKKEAMLADIALGKKNDTKSMESLCEEIANEEKKHSDLLALAIDTRLGINGLETKLAELEQELIQVEKYHSEMVMAFLGQEMVLSAQEYANLAMKLSTVFVKIATLESILDGYGSHIKALTGPATKFNIPELKLTVGQSVGAMKKTGCFFSYSAIDEQKELQVVLKNYAEKGIVIPLKQKPGLFEMLRHERSKA